MAHAADTHYTLLPYDPSQAMVIPPPSTGSATGGSSSSVSSTGWTHGAGSPIALGISTVTYGTYTNDSDDTFWTVANGAWIPIA